MTKERPILFSGPMVRAVLAGRKTVTRRLDLRWLSVKKGDRIWVRETWHPDLPTPIFAADYEGADTPEGKRLAGVERWRPSIYLPRSESRIDLVATEDAREERLHEITGPEIIAEGAVERAHEHRELGRMPVSSFDGRAYLDLVSLWAAGWDAINGRRAPWKSNPPIARVAFKRVRP